MDWGSYAYQCTKEQLEKPMGQTGCEIDKMNELASEKIYGDPRNPNILKMFGFVNVGERAGSGVDKIMTAWAEQNWKKPEFDFSERNDRVTLKLEVGQVVYIPGAADIRDTTEGDKAETITAMSKAEKVLAYIRQNGSISMQKVMEIGNYRSRTGARKLIDKMMKAAQYKQAGFGVINHEYI